MGGGGSRAQGAGVAEGIGVRVWGGVVPSGLGGVGGRGRASKHGVFSWLGGGKSSVLNPTKKLVLSFFGAGGGGSLVGGDRGQGRGGRCGGDGLRAWEE